jgi:hypothetical protein
LIPGISPFSYEAKVYTQLDRKINFLGFAPLAPQGKEDADLYIVGKSFEHPWGEKNKKE